MENSRNDTKCTDPLPNQNLLKSIFSSLCHFNFLLTISIFKTFLVDCFISFFVLKLSLFHSSSPEAFLIWFVHPIIPCLIFSIRRDLHFQAIDSAARAEDMSLWISEQDKRTFPSASLAKIPEADRFWLSLYAPSKLILMKSHLRSRKGDLDKG